MEFSFLKKLKESLLKNFAIYLGSSIISKAIPFLLLPILTKYLSTAEYGTLAIYQVMISFAMPFIGMNMHNNITRNFFKKSKQFLSELVFNLVIVLSCTTALLLLFITIYISFWDKPFSIPNRWFYVLPVIAFMNMLNTFNLTILRNEKEAFEYGYFQVSKTIIDLSLSVILIVIYSYGWEGRTSGILVATSIIGIISLYRIWDKGYLLFRVNFTKIKQILKISIPLIPHVLGGTILTLADRVFIDKMVNTSAVGIYTIGYQFGMIMNLIVMGFIKTWSPWMYDLLSQESQEKKFTIVKATYLAFLGFLVVALFVTIASQFLLPFMTTEEFHQGIVFVKWVAYGYAFFGMYTLVYPYGVHVGKTSYLGFTTFSAAIINIVANYLLIKMNGAIGAAQATLISYLFMFIIVFWYSNKLYPMPWIKFLKKEKEKYDSFFKD